MHERLEAFSLDGRPRVVHYVRSEQVKEGVVCDVYTFPAVAQVDLAIVTVERGCSTPRQRVVSGVRTLEVHVEGEARFELERDEAGGVEIYAVARLSDFEIEVPVGATMQWHALGELTFAEVCFPPYEPGRFVDLPE